MAKKSDDLAAHRINRKQKVESKERQVVTLKDLRKAAKQTQKDLADALGVGQDTISRLEKRSDMLLSTLQHYVECIGGRLELVAVFPDRPPVVIDRLAHGEPAGKNGLADQGATHIDRPRK